MPSPYPLTFEPILKLKVWGGRRLARYGKALPEGVSVGESWEIADLATTSPGGGGGGAARSVISRGGLAGQTLQDAMRLWGRDLLGPAEDAGDGGFPLLVKFLDAAEHLSVQVHPSLAYCREHPEAHLKSEAWVVAEAEPQSVIFKGLRAGVTKEDARAALQTGEGDLPRLLEREDAVPGDCHFLPSGTVHALGAGVLVLEVQTASDSTFRLYDWQREYGRPKRELHIDAALACMEEGPAPKATRIPQGQSADRLAASEQFDLWSYNLPSGSETTLPWARGRCLGIACLSGAGQLRDGGEEPVVLAPGSVVLVPAAIAERIRLAADASSRVVCFGVGPAGE